MEKESSKKLPEIIIKYSPKLDPIFLGYIRQESKHKELWQKWKPWSIKQVEVKVAEHKKEWSKYEKDILTGMCTVLNTNFHKNIIDVYLVAANIRNFNDPIVIGGIISPQEFVVTLTHELVHELLPYTEDKSSPDFIYLEIFKEMFPKEHRKTILFHVVLYAIIEHLFKDILQKPQLWDIAVKETETHEDYKKTITILKEQGYKNLIKEFKDQLTKYKTTPEK